MKNEYDVIIIGAGITGISAALQLQKKSSKWLILEAQNKVGGRIQSIMIDNVCVDTGAYEIASYGQESQNKFPLLKLMKEMDIELENRIKLSKVLFVDETGVQFTKEDHQIVNETLRKLKDLVKDRISKNIRETFYDSIHESLQVILSQNNNQLSERQKRLLNLQINMMEQEQAGSMFELSSLIFGAQDTDEKQLDAYPLPKGTYHKMIEKFARTLPQKNIQFNTKVSKIIKSQNEVIIQGNKGLSCQVFKCKKVVCTVPLGILKNKQVEFHPPLPQTHQQAIQNIGYGVMDKIILAFQKPFWKKDTLRIKIASSQKGKFPHFINLSTEESHILCCFFTDDFSKALHKKYFSQQIAQMTVSFLKEVFPKEEINLKQYFVTDWAANSHVKGSFSFLGPKSDLQTTKTLRSPVNNWLWIAGEHCYGQNMGTAHGAFSLGLSAAEQIISKLQQEKQH